MSETPSPDSQILFFSEDIDFELEDASQLEEWIRHVVKQESASLHYIHFIFCSDTYLHQINLNYLQHDTLTDVITFPYSESPIEGDVFISIDRVRDNARLYEITLIGELKRVMVHGTLHLLGYGDKTVEEKENMTRLEDQYLALLTEG